MQSRRHASSLLWLLASGWLGCDPHSPSPSGAPRVAEVIGANVIALPEATFDDLRNQAEVFRLWKELPSEQQSKIAPAVFDRHIVVRVHVALGCVAKAPSERPKGGYLWPRFAQQCIEGTGRTHPLHTIEKSAVRGDSAWERPGDVAYEPLLSVLIDSEGTSLGLAPPIVSPCNVTIVDTHWLAVPRGRVTVGMTEGSSHCDTTL